MFIEVKGLEKSYSQGEIEFAALKDVSFSMEQGQIAVILGPSGSGKSTLLNIMGGIDSASAGHVIIDGTEITGQNEKKLVEYRRNDVGFIFQFYNLIPNLTVYENICVSEDISTSPLDIEELMREMGLYDLRDRFPRELSGGQQQRVSIARALVKNPRLLFCDEPTGALDYAASREILMIIEKICAKYHTTVFIITHNTAIAAMAHRVLHLRDGKIAEDITQLEKVSAESVAW